ncbi:MAG: putative regulator, ArsR family, partial [Mycobacterium sp.]|nr:putative regulator, ArsR family [Mycobacterium sp.]
RYAEAEVNVVLRAWHPDHAALRRYLVDEGFLGRERGEYWRTGGRVEL